jgi:hypothetical protein
MLPKLLAGHRLCYDVTPRRLVRWDHFKLPFGLLNRKSCEACSQVAALSVSMSSPGPNPPLLSKASISRRTSAIYKDRLLTGLPVQDPQNAPRSACPTHLTRTQGTVLAVLVTLGKLGLHVTAHL